MSKKLKIVLISSFAVLLIAGGILYRVKFSKPEAQAVFDPNVDRTYNVKVGDMTIGLLQGGYVNASQKHKIAMQANLSVKLIWVIDENTPVKSGDVLARFETDGLKKTIEDLETELENLKKELEIAFEDEKILVSTNAAGIQSAQDTLQQSQDALRKYRRFDRRKNRDNFQQAIVTATTTLSEAQKSYNNLRDSDLDSTADDPEQKRRDELNASNSKILTAQNTLRTAEDNLKVFYRYDRPTQMTKLQNAVEQAELNLRKVIISVDSSVVQKKRLIKNLTNRIRTTDTQLERHRSYLEMMTLVAPVAGVVIYGDPDRRWGRLDVKTGIDVGRGQVVITIPEMSNLVVDFDLPEQYRSKVKIGDKVIVSPDSLPGEKFSAYISQIATLPVNMVDWDASSPKIYKSRIAFVRQSPRLVNGMSVQLNIVTKLIPDTLAIPVEAVFENNDRFFVYIQSGTSYEERTVSIGEANDNFVQIPSGLEPGDVVFLYRPFQKKQE